MADTMRLSGGLPTVKCSNCHAEINIASMGEHICSRLSEASTPKESIPWRTNSARSSRPLPARIDPLTANRSFPHRDAPKTEGGRGPSSTSSRRGPNSTSPGTAPSQSSSFRWRETPPSPEKSNLGCAFPPFQTRSIPSKTASDFPRREASKLIVATHTDAPEPSPLYGPLSPRTYGGENVVQRMNGIAPGPFGVKEQRKLDQRQHQNADNPGRSDMSSSVTGRNQDGHGVRKLQDMAANIRRDYREPAHGLPSPPRSRTFATEDQPTTSSRGRPTEPTLNTHSIAKPVGNVGLKRENLNGATGGPPLSAAAMRSMAMNSTESRYDPRFVTKQYNAGANQADQFSMGNPYHTPTESVSSNGSGYGSDTKTASSRSTPPMPESPERLTAMTFGGSLPAHPHDNVRYDKGGSALHLSSNSYQDGAISTKPRQPPAIVPTAHHNRFQAPGLPLDPVMAGGKQRREPSQATQFAESTREKRLATSERAPMPTKKGNCKGCGETIQGKSVSSADGRLTGRYHKQCKPDALNLDDHGPGLTSRWAGFVCRTCNSPFDTTTFYVLNNHPYCEQHYHQLNNSLCQACDRGIEGQYLETERRQKYHPDCLTCQECRRILRDEYYEMNGRVYCERHAFKLSQQSALLGPGGRRNPERRTTRMLVMG
ncbi:MAG: hypothetical protein M1816_007750 [Peltula sp. TS41687]|nr:MAG: hypothetical protein M1816_007750 [Peltula sp. TS41687]